MLMEETMKKKIIPVIIVAAALTAVYLKTRLAKDFRYSGTLEATEVKVSAKVSGQIEQLLVQEGSDVKAGDTLAVLDHATLEFQWRQAEAGVWYTPNDLGTSTLRGNLFSNQNSVNGYNGGL